MQLRLQHYALCRHGLEAILSKIPGLIKNIYASTRKSEHNFVNQNSCEMLCPVKCFH